ncbi:MAG TPA: DUF721 domain-containing protein [Hellea balneolensis]|uniref:DUF721 domain-containing protein n=1 Tax=Hellea balneolensis TaxID=287478 RepID=A0A7V5U1F3_9PROT|nr:DUF721 domain-containing protein [Hellea balneolensis]
MVLDASAFFGDCRRMTDNMPSDKTDLYKIRSQISRYLQDHRGRPQYRPAPQAGRAVARVLKPLRKKFGGGIQVLKSNWTDIAGQRLSAVSQPLAIRGDKSGRTLLIMAKGPAATLVEASSRQILQKANQYLGPGHLKRLRVQQGSLETDFTADNKTEIPDREDHVQPTLDKPVQNRLEPDLQTSLARLRRAMDKRTQKLKDEGGHDHA